MDVTKAILVFGTSGCVYKYKQTYVQLADTLFYSSEKYTTGMRIPMTLPKQEVFNFMRV